MSAGLTHELRERARAEGFDAVGIARADGIERHAAVLAAWLRRDYHATMAWMARDEAARGDPRRVLSGCRSVVALAMNHGPHEPPEAVAPGRGRVARYARGRDYHKILGGRLRRVAAWLEERTGLPARSAVDTLPVLERAWAERSGIGWIGKNANLLTRDLGSWVLLGEILTAADLEPDAGPAADHCGSCTACIDACPTGAIVEPGVVDANRCVSYWTIEHRGAIAPDRRAGIGTWMFGCDDCQTVCPWNVSFAHAPDDDRFEVRDDLRSLDPVEILAMDEAEFRRRYSGTSLMRATFRGMRRNACVVLGNLRDPRTRPALEAAASDPDPVVRSHAAWALDRLGLPSSGDGT